MSHAGLLKDEIPHPFVRPRTRGGDAGWPRVGNSDFNYVSCDNAMPALPPCQVRQIDIAPYATNLRLRRHGSRRLAIRDCLPCRKICSPISVAMGDAAWCELIFEKCWSTSYAGQSRTSPPNASDKPGEELGAGSSWPTARKDWHVCGRAASPSCVRACAARRDGFTAGLLASPSAVDRPTTYPP